MILLGGAVGQWGNGGAGRGPFDPSEIIRRASHCLCKAVEGDGRHALGSPGRSAAEDDGDAGRRSEVLAYHNAERFQRGRGDGGMELGSEFLGRSCRRRQQSGDHLVLFGFLD